MGKQVEAVRTSATVFEALAALSDAHEVIFGERPPLARLLILAAQSALETGRWQKMKNWSVGGVKASASGPYDWAEYPTKEVFNGKEVTLYQPFRAYPSLASGMADWVEFLRQDRFKKALERADAFDARGYAAELKKQRYYTGDEGDYAAGVESIAGEFARLPMAWPPLIKLPPASRDEGNEGNA